MTATANPELIEEIANKFEENVTIVEKKPEEKQTAEHESSESDDSAKGDSLDASVGPKIVEETAGMSKSEGALPCPSLRHVKLHPLEYSWSFWFLKGDRTKSWFDCLQKVAEIHTIEDFWEMYHDNSPASSLRWGSDYYLFKTDIQPMWEDPKNVNGGRWLASVDKLDEYWLELLMAVIGEQFEEMGSHICGAAVMIRQKGDKVALWTCNAEESFDDGNKKIGEIMKKKLGIASQLQYVVHRDSASKRGSGIKPKLTV